MLKRLQLNAVWRNRLLVVIFLYFTFWGGTLVTELDLWPRIAHHIVVTLIMGGWIFGLLMHRKPWPSTPLNLPILAFFVVYAMATAFAADPRVSVEGLWQIAVHCVLFYILVSWARSYHPTAILRPLFFASAVVILVGVFEFVSWYLGLGWLPIFRQGWPEIGGLRAPIPPVIYRLSFTLGVSTFLSGYLALLIPVGLAWLLTARSKDTRRAMSLWLVGALLVEGLSFSRGGLLSLAISLPTLGVLIAAASPLWRGRIVALLHDWRVRAGLVAALAAVVVLGVAWTRTSLAGHRSGDLQRFDLWRSAWSVGLDHPLTGVGPLGYGRALRAVRDPTVTLDHLTTPHNVPLMAWAEAGLPGVLALAWIVVVLGRVAWRRWRDAEGFERLRVAGVCAGLLGFGVHNLFDTLLATPVMFPALALVAYLVEPYAQCSRVGLRWRCVMPVVALVLLLLSAIGWGISDWAQYHFSRAIRLAGSGDLQGALAELDTARRIDPAMGFYDAQRAQYLGQLALKDETYLSEALVAYEAVLSQESSYDLIHANYAALLARSSDLEAALMHLQQAVRLKPDDLRYALWVGQLAEGMGESELAQSAYLKALSDRPEWVTSGYWEGSNLRVTVRDSFLRLQGLDGVSLDSLTILSPNCWMLLLEGTTQVDTLSLGARLRCEGEIALRMQHDPGRAIGAFKKAIESVPAEAVLYRLRAEAYLALNDPGPAERDARTALFLGDTYAYTVLGHLAEMVDDFDSAERDYLAGGPAIIQWQGWDVAVYARRGDLLLLPEFDTPGPSRYDFASWLALARLYAEQGRNEEAQAVRDAILALDPFFEFAP